LTASTAAGRGITGSWAGFRSATVVAGAFGAVGFRTRFGAAGFWFSSIGVVLLLVDVVGEVSHELCCLAILVAGGSSRCRVLGAPCSGVFGAERPSALPLADDRSQPIARLAVSEALVRLPGVQWALARLAERRLLRAGGAT
jgi:hypothetical protein